MSRKVLGRIIMNPRGEYSLTTQYEMLDVVSYQGNSYIAREDSIGKPPTSTDFWQCVGGRGDQGPKGEKGDQGNSGVASADGITSVTDLSNPNSIPADTTTKVQVAGAKATATELDNIKQQLYTRLDELTEDALYQNTYNYTSLPLLCGQPPVIYGIGAPAGSNVPINWKQFDPETGEGYNWNGSPSALGQVYIDTTAGSNGRYTACPAGTDNVILKWVNY